MLGRRNPELYGGLTSDELETRIYGWAQALGLSVRCRQTNNEGDYVAWCHEALDWADGVIVNPAAWTHYSYAIRDAIELIPVPVVELFQTQRTLYAGLAELLSGTVAFEAPHLTYDRYETLGAGGLELVPTRGQVEALRAVKDEGELAAIRAAAAITNEVYER